MLAFYLRSLGISTLKNIVYILFIIAGLLAFGERMTVTLFAVIFYAIFFFNGFLFAEWTFAGRRVPVLHVGIVIMVTYAWDMLVAIMSSSWLLQTNMFLSLHFVPLFTYFVLHAIAMVAGFIVSRRFSAQRSLAEGLEA